MRKNYAEEINSSISNFFKIICIIFYVVTGALFLWKTIFGYTKMTYIGDYEFTVDTTGKDDTNFAEDIIANFNVKTDNKYSVHFTCKEKGLDFEIGGNNNYYDYYSHFEGYNFSRKLSLFNAPDGYFVTYDDKCSEREAEHEYRKINRPWGWYILYIVGFAFATAMLLISKKARTTAKRQNAYMRYERVVREKALKNNQQIPEGMSPGEMSMAINQTLKLDKKRKKKSRRNYRYR